MRTHPFFHRDVFAEVEDFARRVDALFDAHAAPERGYKPVLNVREAEDGWTLTADLPGLRPEDLDVHWEGDHLVLEGRVGEAPSGDEAEDEGWTLVRRERGAGHFARRVRFARPVDVEHIEAALDNGVLTVRVPRRAPTRVPVSVQVAS